MFRTARTLTARALVLGLTASVIVVAGPAVAANAAVTSDRPATPTAVEVFTVLPEPAELAADVQFALDVAQTRSEQKPDDFAPPYIDSATGRLNAPTIHETSADAEAPITVDLATLPDEGTDTADEPEDPPPAGEEPAEPARTAGVAQAAAAGTKTFYPVVRQVKYSQAALEATADEAITADVPDAGNIVATYVQEDRNRVIVEVNAVTEATRTALASQYGADKVAIYLDPASQRPGLMSRNSDTNPFKGGSAARTCTNGFSWNNGSTEYMLTAGHCVVQANPQHAWLLPNGSRIGTVTSWDTWNQTRGSVKLPGQNTYAGDVALIDMYGANETIGRLYTGNRTSNASRDVASSGLAYKGKKYCTGGMIKGAICSWKIKATAAKVTFTDGQVGRNLFRGNKKGWCLANGDSGGPVYTTRGDGKIVAKGIIVGGSGGGADHYASSRDAACVGWFSEVRRAEKAFPGALTKRP